MGGLILRCEGEARASKDEVAYYGMIPQAGVVNQNPPLPSYGRGRDPERSDGRVRVIQAPGAG